MARTKQRGTRARTKTAPKMNRRAQRAESLVVVPHLNAGEKMNFGKFLRKVKASPLPKYLAAGVGSYYLVNFAIRYYKSHPEISNFLKENFDTVEGKLREYRSSMMSAETEVRH